MGSNTSCTSHVSATAQTNMTSIQQQQPTPKGILKNKNAKQTDRNVRVQMCDVKQHQQTLSPPSRMVEIYLQKGDQWRVIKVREVSELERN